MNFTEKIEEILQKEAQAILDIPVTCLLYTSDAADE